MVVILTPIVLMVVGIPGYRSKTTSSGVEALAQSIIPTGHLCGRELYGGFATDAALREVPWYQSNKKSGVFFLLSQWLNFKLFGITYLVGKIKFKLFFFRVHWLSESS